MKRHQNKFSPSMIGGVLISLSSSFIVFPIQFAQALEPPEISAIAEKFSVRIEGQNPGSGVLINRDGQNYTVITAAHVVATEDEYDIITVDDQRYALDYKRVKKLVGVDLSVLEFTSSKNYQLPVVGNSNNIQTGESVYVSGFPMPTQTITAPVWTFSSGTMTANARKPLADGYALVYTNNTLPGMSGGAVLNDQGELIGIHGRADAEQVNQKTETIFIKTGFNLGIPLNNHISKVLPNAQPIITSTVDSKNSEDDDFFLKGSEKQKQKQYQESISDFTTAIQINPKFASAYYGRGISKFELGDKRGAIADYDSALKLKPNFPEALNNRGGTFAKIGQYDKAIADLNQAIELKPSFSGAYLNRAVTKSFQGDQQGAIQDYTKAIELKPDNALALSNRSAVRKETGDYTGALVDASQAIQLQPDLAVAHNNSGLARFFLKDYDGAITDLNQAIQLKSDYVDAYNNRGMAYRGVGDNSKSRSDYNRAIELNPNFWQAYLGRGSTWEKLGDLNKTIDDYSTTIKLNPQLAVAYSSRGSAYLKLGQISQAKQDLMIAVQLYQEQGDTQTVTVIQQVLQQLP